MLNIQECLPSKEEMYKLYKTRKLVMDVVNSTVASVLSLWLGHSWLPQTLINRSKGVLQPHDLCATCKTKTTADPPPET